MINSDADAGLEISLLRLLCLALAITCLALFRVSGGIFLVIKFFGWTGHRTWWSGVITDLVVVSPQHVSGRDGLRTLSQEAHYFYTSYIDHS